MNDQILGMTWDRLTKEEVGLGDDNKEVVEKEWKEGERLLDDGDDEKSESGWGESPILTVGETEKDDGGDRGCKRRRQKARGSRKRSPLKLTIEQERCIVRLLVENAEPGASEDVIK